MEPNTHTTTSFMGIEKKKQASGRGRGGEGGGMGEGYIDSKAKQATRTLFLVVCFCITANMIFHSVVAKNVNIQKNSIYMEPNTHNNIIMGIKPLFFLLFRFFFIIFLLPHSHTYNRRKTNEGQKEQKTKEGKT